MNFLDDFFKIFDLSFILYQTAAIITSAVPFWISSAEFKFQNNNKQQSGILKIYKNAAENQKVLLQSLKQIRKAIWKT